MTATDIRLDGQLDETLERDVLAVCRDVVDFYVNNVGTTPPLGKKPIIIRQAPDDKPRACLNGLPREYQINITCLATRRYCQIVYQLAHEMGHVYVDPRESSWFIESCCCAMAYLAEDYMGKKWETRPPFQNWVSYARHFHEYHDNAVRSALDGLQITSKDDVAAWIRQGLPALARRNAVGREHQLVCAIPIEEVFQKHRQSWGALCQLGAATENGRTNFAKWLERVKPDERPLVKRLSELFAASAGAEDAVRSQP